LSDCFWASEHQLNQCFNTGWFFFVISGQIQLATMKHIVLILLFFLLMFNAFSQSTWSHLRGDRLDGHARGSGFPTEFSEDRNISWKTEIPGLAWSSPVVWGNQVWLTNATRNGNRLSAVCVDLNTGHILREIVLFEPSAIQNIHATNSYATPTPAIGEGRVYVHYGTYGTACINTADFSVVWTRTDMNCEHMQGAASSLLLHGELLIVHIEGTDVQYIAALDKNTGTTIWKTERPREFYADIAPVYRKAYTTPIVVKVNGQEQLISNGAQMCFAYDVHTGSEIWSVWYGYDSTVGMPLEYEGLVFFNSGWIFEENTPNYVKFFAVDPTGSGDVTASHVRWHASQDIPQISTPVIVDGRIYMIHERGNFSCLDAVSGKVIWQDKLRGQFNASPVYAGGHIYIPEVRGTIYVIEPGDSLRIKAENKLEGTIKATPAYVNGSMLVRTENHLYRIN
jgi:outer membrane protein assembly factor BamB